MKTILSIIQNNEYTQINVTRRDTTYDDTQEKEGFILSVISDEEYKENLFFETLEEIYKELITLGVHHFTMNL